MRLSHAPETDSAPDLRLVQDMLTVHMQLNVPGQTLALALPRSEWLMLVSGFVKMPADERQRMGVSIREATATSPLPMEDVAMTPKQQRVCDTFVNDCILLAALAEATSTRLLLDTAVESYKLVAGLPQIPAAAKGAFN